MPESKQLIQPRAPFLDMHLLRRIASRTSRAKDRAKSPMTPTCFPKADLSKHECELEVEVHVARYVQYKYSGRSAPTCYESVSCSPVFDTHLHPRWSVHCTM